MQIVELPPVESAPTAYRLLVSGVVTVVAGTVFVMGGVLTAGAGPVCQPGVNVADVACVAH